MQKKKIFIEIDIPGQIKRRLGQKIAKWQDLPVKWTKEENLHLTVAFVGYVDESVIPDICAKVADAVGDIESFDINLERIELGPDEKTPKMFWLTGEASDGLRQLNEAIEKALGTFSHSHKEFRPHLILGKIRKAKWDELIEKPVVMDGYRAVIPVDYVAIMESKGGGAEYVALEQCPLA